MALELRPYQTEAIAAIEDAGRRGVRRPLLGLPTGTGKTVIFAALIRRRGGSALVLAHRDELLVQATEKIRQVDPAAQLGLVKAEASAVAMVIPAEGPSFGIAPAGTWTWMSCLAKTPGLMPSCRSRERT